MKWLCCLIAASALAGISERGELFNTDLGPVNIIPIQNTSLFISAAGRIIYLDPVGEASYKTGPKADIILLTSDKPDSFDPAAIQHISRKNTGIVGPESAVSHLHNATAIAKGETVRSGEIVIEAVAVGYVVTLPGLRVYFSGNGDFFPEMKNVKNIDAAFLAFGPNAMSVDSAEKAVRAMKPKLVYPYGTLGDSTDEARKRLALPGVEVRIRKWN